MYGPSIQTCGSEFCDTYTSVKQSLRRVCSCSDARAILPTPFNLIPLFPETLSHANNPHLMYEPFRKKVSVANACVEIHGGQVKTLLYFERSHVSPSPHFETNP